jgi:hypothetical protein
MFVKCADMSTKMLMVRVIADAERVCKTKLVSCAVTFTKKTELVTVDV